MSLSDKQLSVLRLILRSTPTSDGWYKVSPQVWSIVKGVLPDDLIQTRLSEDVRYLKLTDRGQVVADYIP